MIVDELDPRIGVERAIEPMEKVEEVILDGKDPAKTIQIGKNLPPDVQKEIIDTVRSNQDILARCNVDMIGINPIAACHALNIDPSATPVRQKRRPLDPVRAEAVKSKANKLISIGFLQ